ncbi:hypothetical protein CEUSTIGMA_g4282.t1 [Chlamydomonas eustigma]|uniref:Uncharacterized protein n=1 Tax=Chlamydomonas eustigma TaxID=1157962 RepID=A0A250X1A4_9CHLO|nr:hypothetical protein CEUSTIGMA_g4282.t1 [Chlamydomonas eustigma]|eukprot:GAX76836.1 hypothetical protein CEUSTIGMA_g4282.t1 [Chlamydomonas eustigma]
MLILPSIVSYWNAKAVLGVHSHESTSTPGGEGTRSSLGTSTPGGEGTRSSLGTSTPGGVGTRSSLGTSTPGDEGTRSSLGTSTPGGEGTRSSLGTSTPGGEGRKAPYGSMDNTSPSHMLPSGLRKTLAMTNTPMPEPLARILSTYKDIQTAVIRRQETSVIASGSTATFLSGPVNSSQIIISDIDSALLGVMCTALGTASGILQTVTGALSTIGAIPGIDVPTFSLITTPVSFALSEYAFGQIAAAQSLLRAVVARATGIDHSATKEVADRAEIGICCSTLTTQNGLAGVPAIVFT